MPIAEIDCLIRDFSNVKIEGANILITGGSLGIGRATADLLIRSGANVAITGRNRERLLKTAKKLGAHPIQADVARSDDVQRTYAEFLEAFSGLDCLINNAAFGRFKTLLEITEEDMREVWEANVLGATLMAKEAANIFVEQKRGDIINIASTAALKGFKGGSSYASSKFALRGLSECWRAELRAL